MYHFRAVSIVSLPPARAIVTPSLSRGFDQLAKLVNDASDVGEASQTGPASQMIVCSCNVLSDHDVRNAVSGNGSVPRNARQLYGCLGCSAECGRCARTINTIITEALGPCVKACCAGCPRSHEAASHGSRARGSPPRGVTKMPMMLEAEALQTAAGTLPFAMAVEAIEDWTVDAKVEE